jgi:superfamily II DNA/RNA helicase
MERTSEFRRLGITKPYLHSALDYFSFITPSPVQVASIPLALSGSNLVVESRSGTGKTLAFCLSVLQSLQAHHGVQVLILSSTREVASQIYEFLNEMTVNADPPVYSCLCCGGYSIADIIKVLREEVHIVIGTVGTVYAGRVVDLVHRHKLHLKDVKVCVLDEADKLVSFKDIGRITALLPQTCQFLAFSATYDADSLTKLDSVVKSYQRVQISYETATQLQEYSMEVPDDFVGQLEALLGLLKSMDFHQAVVFYNQRPRARQIAATLRECGFPSSFISGSKSQKRRCEDIQALRFLGVRVVLSTDYASRGVDVLNINLVINFDIPREASTYTHRIGRAGRFGTPGIAVTFVSSACDRAVLCSYSSSAVDIGEFDRVSRRQDRWKPLDLLECEVLHMEALKAGKALETEAEEGEWMEVQENQAFQGLVDQALEGGAGIESGFGEWVDVPEEESFLSRFTVPLFLNTETMTVETLQDRFPGYVERTKALDSCPMVLEEPWKAQDEELEEGELRPEDAWTAHTPPLSGVLSQALPQTPDLEEGEVLDSPTILTAPRALPDVHSKPNQPSSCHAKGQSLADEECSSLSCRLCELETYGEHCHCSVCLDNYPYIAAYLTHQGHTPSAHRP